MEISQYIPIAEIINTELVTSVPEGTLTLGNYQGSYYLILTTISGANKTKPQGIPQHDEEQVSIWSFASPTDRTRACLERGWSLASGQ
jgi:negative regulator of genetic competence, sporulation and motility